MYAALNKIATTTLNYPMESEETLTQAKATTSISAISPDDLELIRAWHQPIVLIGLMGAGKSTVGRRLARATQRQFVDSDEEIEQAAACSISDIFAIHGEPIFRDLEQRVIFRLMEKSERVMATGGGAWMQPDIRARIKERALSVWLKADLDVLVDRVERRNHRPLLESGDKRTILDTLMHERYPIYSQADMTIESGDGPHDDVVEKVLLAVSDYVRRVEKI